MTLAEVFALLAFIVSLLLTIMWTTPFLIFIIDVSTQIVKRALLSYAASRKISSADHKADAFYRILLYSDAFMLYLVYRVSASFCGHSNAFSVLFGASKMHIFAFLKFLVFSIKFETRPMHSVIQFYYSQMPFVCQ